MLTEQNQILLSICIPTYNRANFLSDTLLAIAPQVDRYCNICELIISDNASEDETKSIVKEYQNDYNGIQYFVNSQNLGGRQNIWKVTTYATGKYIWILGDDDMPTPGSVSHIIGIISQMSEPESSNLKIIILNSIKVRDNFTGSGISWGQAFAFKAISSFTYFENGLEILNYFPIKELGFISALVVERESWLKSSYTNYPKSWMYPHLYSLVELAASGSSYYSPRICTLGHKSDQSWCLDRGVFTYCYEFPHLYELAVLQGFSKIQARNLVHQMWLVTIKQYIKMLIFSDVYFPKLSEIKKYHGSFWYFWLIILPIDYICRLKLLNSFVKYMILRNKPGLLIPRTSVEFEA